MAISTQSDVKNLLLRALPANAFSALLPHLTPVDLPLRHVLVEADQATGHLCFIEAGLASVVASSNDNERVEVGHVGMEGMTGTHVILAVDNTPHRTFMQAPGVGLSVPMPAFLAVVGDVPGMEKIFLRYVHTTILQLAHSALASARYNVHERLARWLLMAHDRMADDNVPLTHEFLALMLGVRRSGVTSELHILEGMHTIKATRGNIRITDRSALENVAGGCYGVAEDEYQRLIGIAFRKTARR